MPPDDPRNDFTIAPLDEPVFATGGPVNVAEVAVYRSPCTIPPEVWSRADVVVLDKRVQRCRIPGVPLDAKWKQAQRALQIAGYRLAVNTSDLLGRRR